MLNLIEVALAGLLYDTGKLLQRGNGGFDEDLLRKLDYSEAVRETVLGRHGQGGSAETRIVLAADSLASSFRRKESEGSEPEAPLNSIFNFVGDKPAPENRGAYLWGEHGAKGVGQYLPRSLEEARAGSRDLRWLEKKLVEGFGRIGKPPDVVSVMNLLERYGSHVRSAAAGAGTGDVSLYDHSRVTAALSVCIAGHLNESGAEATRSEVEDTETARYLFVRGDLSGVQRFIYTITSKGALRMLRARSFFLELLAEHVVARVLEHSGVPRTNVIFVGGGGFQLLLPNTDESRRAVEKVRGELNATLAESFGGDLYLALASVPCDARGISGDGLGETLGELGRDLSKQKARKFRESLPNLLGETREPGKESCDVCTRDDGPVGAYDPGKVYKLWTEGSEESINLCETCRMLHQASRKLVSERYLTRDGRDLYVGGAGYGLSSVPRNVLYALDGVGDDACLSGAVPLPSARYAMPDERESDQIMDFDTLASRAAGIERLAVLRMDVDNLGRIFGSGLPEGMRTFDRYAVLSRAFTTFFKVVVPKICEGKYGDSLRLFSGDGPRAAAVVYSGGDDLFIVGAWSDVLELAVDIRRAFREFVCRNPSVTLSAGVSIHSPGEPLYLMAEQAGKAEKTAKGNKRNGREKDSTVLFHRGAEIRNVKSDVPVALFWEEVEDGVVKKLLEQIETFRDKAFQDGGKLPFPRGFIRLLIDVVEVYEREGRLSLPRLAYALARMEEAGKLRDDGRWQNLKRDLLEIETIRKHLRPAAYWLDLAERKREEE